MPRIVDKAAKRQRVIEAAVAVFAVKGFQGASIEEVAVRAGIGKGTVYEYFRSKEDLFYASFEWLEEMTLGQASAAMADCSTSINKLQTLVRASIEVISQYIEFYPLTLEVWAIASTGTARERFTHYLKKLYARYRANIEAILREGQAQGDFRQDLDVTAIAALLFGAIDGAILQSLFDRSVNVANYVDGFLEVMIRGMEPDSHE